ncbi:hypothetical protein OGR47_08410 [Methylocystis sp. MJC1]|uniref:hypothetical protein n=1 Tax=Methylocystis sp. MJC1 TaxID=2654282 RepID=UPI0013EC83A3|nr:hypothetical protein [Methylocystis sp. MJC1]KAF2991754.1 hypothetical protein MJC1_01319 [Methylocystis sp. MJC1]MBU6527007.1 hypothetical protein [Methylocystis sp. MJC1]UZX13445.1 hypothetical protein OGR47_08410 [Methylocystis sp. MJC1]
MIAAERLRPTPFTRPAAVFLGAFLGAALLAAAPVLAQQTQPATPPREPPSQAAKTKAPAKGAKKPAVTKSGASKPSEATTPQGAAKQPPAPAAPQTDEGAALPTPPLDTSAPPPMLPRASRERMRACAEEWEKHKRVSRAAVPLWRDFATECLTR